MNSERQRSPLLARVILVRLRFLLVFALIGLVVVQWDWLINVTGRWFRPARVDDPAAREFQWFCPMHASVVRDELANCPSCGMPLSKRKRGESAPLPGGVLAQLHLSPYRIRQAGVATSEVEYRPLVREVRAIGSIAYDDRRVTVVTVRIAGRVDDLFVGFKGARVKVGDPLYRIFTPGSGPPQREFLQLLASHEQLAARPQVDRDAVTRALTALEASRQRLRLWGLSDDQIAELEASRELKSHLVVTAPAAGVVVKTDIQVGQELLAGQRPYTIADDSEVRAEIEIFERDLGLVAPGQGVEIETEAHAGRRSYGAILYSEPELDAATHTVKLSLVIDNADGRLRPGMHVTARMWFPIGRVEPAGEADAPAPAEAVTVPDTRVFVCDMHKEFASATPGKCEKCGAMELTELVIRRGSALVFTCREHLDVRERKAGPCPHDGKPLEFRVIAQPAQAVTEWVCPIHPLQTSPAKAVCPESGREMKLVRRENVLSVPVSAVIDTGSRRSVFVDRGGGIFEAVAVTVGPRAGVYYPVLAGLKAGDRVVTAGAFLLDAEAHLNPAAAGAYFGSTGHETHR